MNNNMETNYTPGQIICCRSTDSWVYISVLSYTKPQNASGAMQLHTCCDLSIDGDDGSKSITFARGNGTLLDVDTTFEEVRKAYGAERVCLYDALIKAFKDYDLGWDKHFTDSTYDDIRDWLCWEFDVNLDSLADNINAGDNNPLVDTIYEITNYIWDALCKETDNYQACTDYVEPEMVNKQEFIEKVVKYLEANFPDIENVGSEYKESFINNFRKTMEEQNMLNVLIGFLFGLACGLTAMLFCWRHYELKIGDLKLKHKIWEE